MRIAVVGAGYVGLVTASCLAEAGNSVVCVDVDERKLDMLREGRVPFYEPGLEELMQRNLRGGRLSFGSDLTKSVSGSRLVFIAVGTPSREDGSADVGAVFAVAEALSRGMKDYTIVITKSTVPVGTTRGVKNALAQLSTVAFDVVSNPEFLKEGNAVDDFMKPDRVVIGVETPRAAEVMKELYAPFVRTENPVIVMDLESAEMTKYAANALLAMRISFMNEIAGLCELVGADVELVRKGAGADKRIGYPFLFPGVGYGGSCFPKDVRALIRTAEDHSYELKIARAVDQVNVAQRDRFFAKMLHYFGGNVKGKRIAVWGLAFKPGTDDMREAPSVAIVESLLKHGAEVRAYDPKANKNARAIFGERVVCVDDCYAVLEGADALAVITEWSEFRSPDFARIKQLLKEPVVFDGRNIYDNRKLRSLGFQYHGVGRP